MLRELTLIAFVASVSTVFITAGVTERSNFFLSVLAELMLPDGAHLREEDWTMFFLNQSVQDASADNASGRLC